MQKRHLKWTADLNKEIRGYIGREETKMEGRRAVKDEEQVEERPHCQMLQECAKEKKKDYEQELWKMRTKYYELLFREGNRKSEKSRKTDLAEAL
ncbi:hypothetical protein Zmor_014853 [Zophobas morio]|uniref:Uncharacterized protein n=1 Tax=Zophobas morio TaxID=2755281 RepID=A0AA38IGX0_9CUCU|nr:hypothetical protein Zmor_014853 [Zophobas morio]